MTAKAFNYLLTFLTLVLVPLLLVGIISRNPMDAITIGGILFIIPSYFLLIVARYQLGGSFAVTAQAKELVSHGIYSKIRHPVYLFAQIMFFGLILCARQYFLLAPWLLLVAVQINRAKKEEKILEQTFGQTYLDYKKQTWF